MTTTVGSGTNARTVNNVVRHEYRVLNEDEKRAMKEVKDRGLDFLSTLDLLCKPGRETALARTKIEEAVMWAVKGITG